MYYDATTNSSRIPPKITLAFFRKYFWDYYENTSGILPEITWDAFGIPLEYFRGCFRKSFWNYSRNATEIFTSIFLKFVWDSSKNPVGNLPDIFLAFFREAFWDTFENLSEDPSNPSVKDSCRNSSRITSRLWEFPEFFKKTVIISTISLGFFRKFFYNTPRFLSVILLEDFKTSFKDSSRNFTGIFQEILLGFFRKTCRNSSGNTTGILLEW